jgi:hypothetical protein
MADLLKHLLPDAPRERSTLLAAIEAGLADTICGHVAGGMDARTAVVTSAASLAAQASMPIDACCWAVAELALALGLITADQANAIGSDSGEIERSAPGSTPSPWQPPPVSPGCAGVRPADGREPPDPAGVPDWLPPADGDEQPGQKPAGQRAPTVPHDPVSQAVRKAVRPGLLAFNPPTEMVQGRSERVEVGIARSPELRAALATGLRGRGALQFAGVDTSAFMGVELRGSSFDIIAFSPPEQLIAPLARWEFDVTPVRAGLQTLTLCVNLRIDSPVTPGGRIAVPVLERDIRIRVDVGYRTRRFVTNNWQWLIATALGLGGALTAWIALFH